ncbi:cyclic nucleotide-gated cation channel alpha-4 [Mobula hypostoma]|uniref:cyclic nucleotide-gated cation channel alpha-4 n=1 Tax=Mobula hypostoma TaxID=723540 RepID=UPI002FC394B9
MQYWGERVTEWARVSGGAMGAWVNRMRQTAASQARRSAGSPSILDPMGDVYYYWLVIASVPIVYNWTALVARCSFSDLQCRYLSSWLALDYLSDFIYLLNVVIRLNTGHLEQGVLVTDRRGIARRYLHSSAFRLDAVSLLPTDLLALWLGLCSPAVRLNRLVQLPRLLELLERAETRTSRPNALRVGRVMGLLVLAIHWNACAYFSLSARLGFGTDDWVYPNMSTPGGDPRLAHQYLYSVHFATLVLTTMGSSPQPSSEAGYLFMVGDLLIAVLTFAGIVGSVESTVSEMQRAKRGCFPDHRRVRDYLRREAVNPALAQRVSRWAEHLRLHAKRTDEEQVLRVLPGRLRALLAADVHLRALDKVRLFSSCEAGLLRQLVARLRLQVFSPGDLVCRRGEVGREMYIVQEGRLAVLAQDGRTELARLQDGSYFGEISILNVPGNKSGNRRTASIRSLGYSDLFVLGKGELAEVLLEFPEARRALEDRGREMLQKMGMLEEGAAQEDGGPDQLLRKAGRLETALDLLHTRLARLMAEHHSSLRKMNVRLSQLEGKLNRWGADPGQAEAQQQALSQSHIQVQAQLHDQTQALPHTSLLLEKGGEGPAHKQPQSQAPSQSQAQDQVQTEALSCTNGLPENGGEGQVAVPAPGPGLGPSPRARTGPDTNPAGDQAPGSSPFPSP